MGNISGNTGWKEGKEGFLLVCKSGEVPPDDTSLHSSHPQSQKLPCICHLVLVVVGDFPSLHCTRLPICSYNFPWFFCIFPCTFCVVTAPSSCRSFVWLCKFIPTPSALTLCPWLSASLSFALIQWTQVCSYNIIYCLLHLSSGHRTLQQVGGMV